jgi:ribonucleotide reductase alpha subunit
MKSMDSIGYKVGQKGRVPAMLLSLNVSHPDIEEFIKAKSDFNAIQNANISVQVTNDFYYAVLEDAPWELRFEIPSIKKGDKVRIDVHSTDMNSICELDEYGIKRYYKIATHDRPYELISKTVRAVDILEMIAKGMFGYAEPGIQNIDIARKYSNSDYLYNPFEEYDPRILGTNAPVIGTSLVPTSSGLFPIKDLYDRQQEVKVISDTITTLPLNLVYWKSKERELRASIPRI